MTVCVFPSNLVSCCTIKAHSLHRQRFPSTNPSLCHRILEQRHTQLPCSSPLSAKEQAARPRSLKCRARSTQGDEEVSGPKVYPVPRDASEQIEQAMNATQRAWEGGVKRQRVELLLPLIGATDLDDWPGGVRQQFKAIRPMVEGILLGLKKLPGLEGSLRSEILDQGDAVGLWQSPSLAAVVFPTSETLSEAREVAKKREGKGLVLMFNPQWQSGQVISDFGIGPWRKRAEDFVDSFEQTYYLKQFRVLGDDVKILRCYPSQWQVHVNDSAGVAQYVTTLPQKPAYKELETILKAREGSNAAMGWADRLRAEMAFNVKSMKE